MCGVYPHCKVGDESGAPWDELIREIEKPGNAILFILGANGVDTFGARGSPLYDVMQRFRGTTRVILAAPMGDQTAGRAEALGVDVREYRKAIISSQARMRELHRQMVAVEGRFYTGQPNWKLIITGATAWVQYYLPGQHVNETPVYRFDCSESPNTLYNYFRMEFDRIWRRCASNPMKMK